MPSTESPYWFLDPADLDALGTFLTERGVLDSSEIVESAGRAGEGNMNCTLRVRTGTRSIIVKQSRPFVEKYPTIAAPQDRILMEARFYHLIAEVPELRTHTPSLIDVDPAHRIMVLEDLGDLGDLSSLYAGDALSSTELDELIGFLAVLHTRCSADTVEPEQRIRNRDMRSLNHEFIFHHPFDASNGMELDAITPGLQALAATLQGNRTLVQRIHDLGTLYLADGDALLHGDFFPGSWMRAHDRVVVIDPEFCFFGPREFDLGVMLAHLRLADAGPPVLETVLDHGRRAGLDADRLSGFAGVEVMRRLIGVAQLPLERTAAQKESLLHWAQEAVLGASR